MSRVGKYTFVFLFLYVRAGAYMSVHHSEYVWECVFCSVYSVYSMRSVGEIIC